MLQAFQTKWFRMKSSRKRQRERSDSEDEESNNAKPAKLMRAVQSPAMIFEKFLRTVKDVTLLKKCRTVCHSWNTTASLALQSLSHVILDEDIDNSDEFRNLIMSRGLLPRPWPIPFQKAEVRASKFKKDNFNSLIILPTFVIETLRISLRQGNHKLNQERLVDFLIAKGSQIKELIIEGADETSPRFVIDASLEENEEIHLSALKVLKVQDGCARDCSHVELLEAIKSCSPRLETIDLDVLDVTIPIRLLSTSVARSVQKVALRLDSLPSSAEEWNMLAEIRLPALKEFSFCVMDNTDTAAVDYAEQVGFFAAVVEKVSGTIEVLSSNAMQPEILPYCPKLKSIRVEETTFAILVSGFTPSKFPSLERISLGKWEPCLSIETEFEPHEGVRRFDVQMDTSESFLEGELPVFLTYLRKQFPKMTEFSLLGAKHLTSTTLRDIYPFFPRLKSLEIDGQTSFLSLSGMKVDFAKRFRQQGETWDKIPRRISIIDFYELESLKFGKNTVITDDMITYCLSVLPKLRSLEFRWNESLSVETVQDCLGHVKTINLYGVGSDLGLRGALAAVANVTYSA